MGGFRRVARAALAASRQPPSNGFALSHPGWRRPVDAGTLVSHPERTSSSSNQSRIGRLILPRCSVNSRGFAGSDAPRASDRPPVVPPGWGDGGDTDDADPDGTKRRALEVAIDRAGLFRTIERAQKSSSSSSSSHAEDLTGLEAHLASIIRFRGGPITLAEFMQECLTHPEFGYYMHRDVFGKKGDFTTSPEVSQAFGELMGAWAAWTWESMGKPSTVRIVELGPGRGTLMGDLLRGTKNLPKFTAAATVHMVDVSPANRTAQRETLKCGPKETTGDDVAENSHRSTLEKVRVPKNPIRDVGDEGVGGSSEGSTPEELGLDPVDVGVSGINGAVVEWHETLDGVPPGPTILIAHEFFDAMPVHQFTRTERGWCERLVSMRGDLAKSSDEDGEDEEEGGDTSAFEMVLSPGLTPAGALMVPRRLEGVDAPARDGLRQLEISPRSLAIWERIAARLERHGGAAIAVDYGEEGPLGDTLQAIKDHEFVDVLTDPGRADLSAYVDFGAMRRVIECRKDSGVECFGPVTQRDLLFGLGIGQWLEKMVEKCSTEEEVDRLIAGCERLVSGEEGALGEGGKTEGAGKGAGMGFRYKALAMVSKGLGKPAGF